jgi:hypothetical protein
LNYKLLILCFLFFFETCAFDLKKDRGIVENLPISLSKFLNQSGGISLLLLTPLELQSSLCNHTEEFLEVLNSHLDSLRNQNLLETFQGVPQFTLVDTESRRFSLKEQKFQMLGFTKSEISKLGLLTGATHLAITSSKTDCSPGNKEIFYESTTKLIETETGKIWSIDSLTLQFHLNVSQKRYEFSSGKLNGNSVFLSRTSF